MRLAQIDALTLRTTFSLVLIALEVINKCLETLIPANRPIERWPHRNALLFLKLSTKAIRERLKGFKRSVNLNIIADQICGLAQALDNHLASNEEEDRCQVSDSPET
jgi:hypothetical protein